MDQLNVQQTWPPLPELEKHAGTETIDFILQRYKSKYRRETYVRAVSDIKPS